MINFIKQLLMFSLMSLFIFESTFALDQGTLQVTSITPTQTLATPDGDFDNGWQWIFNVTVPNNETVLRLKFANWTSGTSTLTTATNVRFWSPQSSDTNSTTTAKILSNANVYSDTIKINPTFDLSPSTLGRQIQVVVDVRVPLGTVGGSYTSSYGVSTDIDPNQATGVVQYTIDPTYSNIYINGNKTQQIIGQVLITAQNEGVKLNTLRLDPKFTSTTTPTLSGLTNLNVFLNGNQIGSSTDWELGDGPTPFIINFDNDVILPVGIQKTLTIKSNVNFIETTTVSTGTLFTVIGGLANNAQGITTNKLISVFAVPFVIATNTLTNYPALSDISLSVASGFNSSTKSPNQSQVKIGSFTLQTGVTEPVTINTVKVSLSGTAVNLNQITNLTLKDGATTLSTPIGNPILGVNNFSTNVTQASNSTKTIDIYADVGSGANNLTTITGMSATVRGSTSNILKEVSEVVGPTTLFATAEIVSNGVTLNAGTSPVSQNIVGGQSNFNIGTFNFKVNNGVGGATLKDITLSVTPGTISSLTMNGKTTAVIGNTATIHDVGIVVPSNNSGVNVPVSASIACVGVSNGCNMNSPATTSVSIVSMTYNDGSSIQSVDLNSVPKTNTFYVFSSKPTLTANSIQSVGLVLGAENKVGEVTVASDVSGSIKIRKIVFNISASGINEATINASRIADGNTTIPGSSCIRGGSLPEYVECTFTGGYTILAGTSKTFNFYSTVTGTPVSGMAGTMSISSAISKSEFLWDDVLGGGINLTGDSIYNFPTGSYTLRN